MKRIHFVQHVPFESPGFILEWARARGIISTSTKLYEAQVFPETGEFDCLVIMGGPMSVNDNPKFAWLNKEKTFIEKSINSDKKVLGICLGAQLIADVLGSKVSRNRFREIGWFPVESTEENKKLPVTGFLPDNFTAFHWHGETFELPSGATRVAESEGCENQGFVYGERVVALQFHLEVTGSLLAEMVGHGRSELVSEKYVQDERMILATREHIKSGNIYIAKILGNLANLA